MKCPNKCGIESFPRLQPTDSEGGDMVLSNRFHLGEVVHNLQTNEVGTIVGYREIADTPEYEVLIRVEFNNVELQASLALWPEGALETSTAFDKRTK
jgi:hypothetical protein